jgi:hypothetical protein
LNKSLGDWFSPKILCYLLRFITVVVPSIRHHGGGLLVQTRAVSKAEPSSLSLMVFIKVTCTVTFMCIPLGGKPEQKTLNKSPPKRGVLALTWSPTNGSLAGPTIPWETPKKGVCKGFPPPP